MSHRSVIKYDVLVDGDMSQASLTSKAININLLDNVGIQLIYTGTPIGVFTIEVSVNHSEDMQGTVITPGTWTPLSLGASAAATGSAGNFYLNLTQLAAPWFRVVYTRSSGAGVLNVYLALKAI